MAPTSPAQVEEPQMDVNILGRFQLLQLKLFFFFFNYSYYFKIIIIIILFSYFNSPSRPKERGRGGRWGIPSLCLITIIVENHSLQGIAIFYLITIKVTHKVNCLCFIYQTKCASGVEGFWLVVTAFYGVVKRHKSVTAKWSGLFVLLAESCVCGGCRFFWR